MWKKKTFTTVTFTTTEQYVEIAELVNAQEIYLIPFVPGAIESRINIHCFCDNTYAGFYIARNSGQYASGQIRVSGTKLYYSIYADASYPPQCNTIYYR